MDIMIRKCVAPWAVFGLGAILAYTPLSAGKVVLSLEKESGWVPYDEHNRDDGGTVVGQEFGETKAYLQFPDYDAMLRGDHRWQAGEVVNRILKRDIKSKVDQKVTIARQRDAVWEGAPLVYHMLYRGSADTRTGTTGNVHFKVSVTGAGPDARTIIVRPAITADGVSELSGDGEEELNIVVQNISTGESFVVAHLDGDQAFIHVYVILGQVKYTLIRGEFQKIKQDLAAKKVVIPVAFQRALRGVAQAAPPVVLAPEPSPEPDPDTVPVSPQPTMPRPIVPLPKLSHAALQHPLVKNNAQSQLWALEGNRWRPYGKLKLAYMGILDTTRKARVRDLLSSKKAKGNGGIPLSQDDRDEAWQGFYDCLPDGIMPIDNDGHEACERLWQQFWGLAPGEGGCKAWDLSDRLGLPLLQATVQFIALPEDGVIQALALPLVAKIADPMSLAVLSIGPNGWKHFCDESEDDCLAVRSFPTVSGIGSPVLRKVFPETASTAIAPNACKWYALTSDLLTRLDGGHPQAVCYFAIHSHGLEMHLTFLQKMPDDPEPVVLTSDPAPVVSAAAAPAPPKFWMDLAGIRLLELRYLAKVYPAIENDNHYRAFLRILHLAYHNHVYYTYKPTYYWDGSRGDKRFGEWRVQDEKRKVTPYVIPYLEQLDLSEGEPRVIYYDFFKSKEARKNARKATELDLMQEQHEDEDVPVNMEEMHRAFTSQWEKKDGVAYKKLCEMKADAILRLSNSGSIRAQMLDLDWWEYRDQLCNAQLGPLLGQEFRDVLSEAVQLEEQ